MVSEIYHFIFTTDSFFCMLVRGDDQGIIHLVCTLLQAAPLLDCFVQVEEADYLLLAAAPSEQTE